MDSPEDLIWPIALAIVLGQTMFHILAKITQWSLIALWGEPLDKAGARAVFKLIAKRILLSAIVLSILVGIISAIHE